MIVTGNVNRWKDKTQAAKNKITRSATKYVQMHTLKVLEYAWRVTPQYTGDLAANWYVDITGYKNPTYHKIPDRTRHEANFGKEGSYGYVGEQTEPKKAGDPIYQPRVDYNKEVIANIKWNSKVLLVNTKPIAEAMEAGLVKIREANRKAGGVPAVMAAIKTKFGYAK